jgi:L-ascorbate metabolism protein UlaG (beta-lactamase superfamily)
MTDATFFGDIQITKTHGGQHGTDRAYAVPELAERLGEACGVVLRHPDEKTLYLAGDTVWRDEVAADLQKHQPDVVVLNAGYAHVIGFGPIIMGQEDVLNVHFLLPQASIVAIHMEAINHCLLTRSALREYVEANQVSDAVSIPQDGETVIF